MTPLERIHRARRWLVAALVLTAVLRGIAVTFAVVLVASLVGSLLTLPIGVLRWIWPVALVVGILGGGQVLWRGRGARSIARLALWIEERQTTLAFALVTAVDSRVEAASLLPGLLAAADQADVEGIVRRASWRALTRAGLLLAVVVLPLMFLSPGRLLRAGADAGGGRGASEAVASRLTPLSVLVTPPAYSRLAARRLEEPGNVDGLPGSAVTFSGQGASGGVSLVFGTDTVRPVQQGRSWSTTMRMLAAAAVVTLHDRDFQRLVVLEPRPDSAPEVVLRLPLHDTTWQAPPTGPLILEARAADDLGLAAGYFEILISAGGGESFETTVSATPRQPLGNVRATILRSTIRLDTLKLVAGSVLSIRAVGLDANDVDGPGRGVSETRTLRVAEQGDTSSVEAQPPDPVDETRLSQRMLNLKTDTLIRARRRLPAAEFAGRSTAYADLQMGIRIRVLEVVSLLEDADEEGSYPTEDSRLLREAADEMLSARRALQAARPDSAMPHMRLALRRLDQVRTAHRYYLRGRRRTELVDVKRVRLQGTDVGTPGIMTPRNPLHDDRADLALRIEAAARLHESAPTAALDSLTWIRVSALASHPAVADALKHALDAFRKGVSADSALAPVRRLLIPGGSLLAGPPEWAGGTAP